MVKLCFMKTDYFSHESACVDAGAEIGEGTRIWHFSHIMPGAKIGRHCNLGQNVFVADGVVIGDNVKIQNNVSLYAGTIVEDDVFLGPSCVLTNVINPRSEVNRQSEYRPTVLRRGVTVGANATIVCGIELEPYVFVGAGAVVTKSFPAYAQVMGNPARRKGWMSRHGIPLGDMEVGQSRLCSHSGLRYRLESTDDLRCEGA